MISTIQSLFDILELHIQANAGDVAGLSSLLFLVFVSLVSGLKSSGRSKSVEDKSTPLVTKTPKVKKTIKEEVKKETSKEVLTEEVAKEVVTEPIEKIVPSLSWSERLKKGLSRSRQDVWGKIGGLFSGKILDDEILEEVEELLYGADLGPGVVAELVEALEEKVKSEGFGQEQFKVFLKEFLGSRIKDVQDKVDTDLYNFDESKRGKTKVIMVVGVNGAGKTTTIGKLATKLTNQGAKVVVGACDTFRAAAVDQLQVWCERAGAEMIRAKEGANPTGVGYEALQAAVNAKADYCILDTAGRLHTAGNLMDELTKSRDVLKKLDEDAPHQTLLVIDAITGQNALRQAEEFNNSLGLTGLIFTKCDGSSKAGSAIGIVKKLQVPITYIGVGESVEDLNIFSQDDYLNALLDF